jgi:hypothetical protein
MEHMIAAQMQLHVIYVVNCGMKLFTSPCFYHIFCFFFNTGINDNMVLGG